MLQTTLERLVPQFGNPSSAPGRHLYNADSSKRFQDKVYRYEVGFILDLSVYAVIEKKNSGAIDDLEAYGFRVLAGGGGEWEIWPKPARNFDPTDPSNDLSWVYTPAKKDDRILRQILCRHQQRRRQLVIYDPLWRPSLAEVASERL